MTMTIKEIASLTGVSVATVSNIINNKGRVGEDTRARVEKVIREHHYRPNSVAKNLKTKTSRSIGVIAEDMTVFVMPEIIDGITECCEENDYQILLVNLRLYKKYSDTYYKTNHHRERVKAEIQKLISMQVDGIIYVAAHERVNDVIPKNLPIPVVMAYSFSNRGEVPSIVVNDQGGAEKITEYLLSKKHEKIGVIAGKRESIHTLSRLEGYQRALLRHQIFYDPDLVVYGDWDRQSGHDAMENLMKKSPTAIFAMNDVMAGGVYDWLKEHEMTPGKDVAVVGYDDQVMSAYENPPLTTVGLPLRDIGYKAGEEIIGMLSSGDDYRAESQVDVDCRLCERESVFEYRG